MTVDVDVAIRLDGDHPLVTPAGGDLSGERDGLGGRVRERHEPVERVPGVEKEGSFALGTRIRKGQGHLLQPGHGVPRLQPTLDRTLGIGPHLQPALPALLLFTVDIIAGEGSDRPPGTGTRPLGQCRPRARQHPLIQGLLARLQQGCAVGRLGRHPRQ